MSEELSPTNPRLEEFQKLAADILQKLESVSSVYEVQSEIEVLEESLDQFTDEMTIAHCKLIVEILYTRLRDKLSIAQDRDMVELRRQMNMNEYFKPKGMGGLVKWTQEVKLSTEVTKSLRDQLSAASDELEKEAEILLATYQTDLDEIVSVRSRIAETSVLMSVLSSKAVEQMDLADSILTKANDSIEYVEKADSQLHKAIQNNSSYRFYVVMWFMTLSVILLILDFIR